MKNIKTDKIQIFFLVKLEDNPDYNIPLHSMNFTRSNWGNIDWISLTDAEILQIYLSTETLNGNLREKIEDIVRTGVDVGGAAGLLTLAGYFGNSVGACAAAGTYGAAICATPSTAIAAGVAALSWPVAIGATVVAGVGLNMVRKNSYMCWLKTHGLSAKINNPLTRYRQLARQSLRHIEDVESEDGKFISPNEENTDNGQNRGFFSLLAQLFRRKQKLAN